MPDNRGFGFRLNRHADIIPRLFRDLYGIDDSRGAARYIFGYLGFSFRHFWAFIRLTFSMLGWILLCFFVAPVFYVGPYALCAAVNSARWLKISDEEKAAKKYIPQPVYTGYTEYTGF